MIANITKKYGHKNVIYIPDKKDVPKKMGQRALAVALSGKVRDKELQLVDNFAMEEVKTKLMSEAIKNLKIKGSIIIGFSEKEKEAGRASHNLPRVSSVEVKNLNVFDVLNHKYLLMSEEGLKKLEKRFQLKKSIDQ